MKKALIWFLLAIFSLSYPIQANAQEFRKSENIIVEENETVVEDFFAVGKNIIISGNIDGDAYLAGENVLVDGQVNGDVILLGKQITIEGNITGSVRAVGEKMHVRGNVQKNITWAGGTVTIFPPANVIGSLTSLAKEFTLKTPLGKGATLAGENIVIDSQINGNLLAAAGKKLLLTENAKIEGDVEYYTGTKLKMTQAPTSSISGITTHNIYVTDREMHLNASPALKAIYLFFKILGILSILLVGMILTLFIPRYTENVAKQIDFHILKSFLVGLSAIILTPIVIIFLFITLIGIPLAILLIPLYLALLFFGSVFAIVFLGQKIMLYLDRQKSSLFVKFLVGLLVYFALSFIPAFGQFISIIAIILGTGAFMLEKMRLFRKMQD